MSTGPVRRRLDLKTLTPGGGGQPFLLANLVDDSQGDHLIANGECTLPDAGQWLGDTGLTVDDFLLRFRQGDRGLVEAARHYGRLLYDGLLRLAPELREPWSQALHDAKGRGLRLEIRLPTGSGATWRGQPVSTLPFELMCDEHGFLFRRPGWATVRRLRDCAPRPLRISAEPGQVPKVLVGWANVLIDESATLPEADFIAHEQAVAQLDAAGRAVSVEPLRHATRPKLATALQQHQPHVLVWIGHGASSGSALVLHDDGQAAYPRDLGTPVVASDFANDARAGAVDVALLWSCHGAGTERALSLGVAEALLHPDQGDLAAVVASFSALEPAAVARFSKSVLEAWAHHPEADLEARLARARSGLDEQSLTWARPVLFLRTPPGDQGVHLVGAQLPPRATVAPRSAALLRLPPLPARVPSYVDRLERVSKLEQDLRHHSIVVVEGLPGVGKTELALAVAHRARQRGDDVAFIDVTGQQDVGNLQRQIGQLVSDTAFEDDGQLFAAMAGLSWTLVVDNAEDLLSTADQRVAVERLLRGLVGASAGFRCVVTSRRALGTAGSTWVFNREVQQLGEVEARELFVAVAGRRLSAAEAQGNELGELLSQLGGLPRAIELMAGQLGDEIGVAALLQRLQALGPQAIVDNRLLGELVPQSLDAKLRAERLVSALNLSLRSAAQQDPHSLHLFEVLGAFPAGLAQPLLPREQFPWITDALGVLLEHHLVSLSGEERRIAISAPVRAYAWERFEARPETQRGPDPLLHAIHEGLATWAGYTARLIGTESSAQAMSAMLVEEPNLLQAMAVLARPDHGVDSEPIAGSLFEDFAKAVQYAGRAHGTLGVLTAAAKRILGRWPVSLAAASSLGWLGDLKVRTADLEGARQDYEQALPIYRQVNARLGEANALRSLGDVKVRTADLEGAKQDYEQALQLYRQINARLGEANALQSLGDLKVRTDDLEGARQDYEQALPIHCQINDRLGEANTLKSLGDLKVRADDLEGARQDYEQALSIYRQINERLGEANALRSLGDLKVRTDDLEGARQDYEQALPIYRQIKARLGEANALRSLGDLKVRAADLEGARQDYEQALPIYRQINERLGEANVLKSLGDLKVRAADLEGARQDYEQALPICRQINDRLGEANVLQALGVWHMAKREDRLAFERVLAALRAQEAVGDRLGAAGSHGYLARIAARTGQPLQSAALAAVALRTFQAFGDRFGQRIAYTDLGLALLDSEPVEGAACLCQAIELARDMGDPIAQVLEQHLAGLRADHVDKAEYENQIATIRSNAGELLGELFARVQARVDAGELDPYAAQGEVDGP